MNELSRILELAGIKEKSLKSKDLNEYTLEELETERDSLLQIIKGNVVVTEQVNIAKYKLNNILKQINILSEANINEDLKQIDGKWALVSKKSGKPLRYFKGEGKPSEEWVKKQEKSIQYFKNMSESLSIHDKRYYDPDDATERDDPLGDGDDIAGSGQYLTAALDKINMAAILYDDGEEVYEVSGAELESAIKKGLIKMPTTPPNLGNQYYDNGEFLDSLLDYYYKSLNESTIINEENYAYDVFLNGKEIDTVFANYNDVAEMKKSLINHDGYDPRIVVRLVKKKNFKEGFESAKSIAIEYKALKDQNNNSEAKKTYAELVRLVGEEKAKELVSESIENYFGDEAEKHTDNTKEREDALGITQDQETKIDIPKNVMSQIDKRISELKQSIELYDKTTYELWYSNKQKAIENLEFIKEKLVMKNMEGYKQAQIHYSSLASIFTNLFPAALVDFLHDGMANLQREVAYNDYMKGSKAKPVEGDITHNSIYKPLDTSIYPQKGEDNVPK